MNYSNYQPEKPDNIGTSHSKSSARIVLGIIILILGVLSFFSSVIIPVFTHNIILMFPFFFGAFVLLVTGMILLTFGKIRTFGRRLGNQVKEQRDPAYDMPLRVSKESNESEKLHQSLETEKELICPYCGTSNKARDKFCKICGSPLN